MGKKILNKKYKFYYLNKAWCKLNMKWTRITTCVYKLEKCYPLDIYLYFFRFHWIWLMYDVMKKEWWPPWWNKVLSQKLWKWRFWRPKTFSPNNDNMNNTRERNAKLKGKWRKKSWDERGKCLRNKKILLILQHLHHMIKWSFANLPFHQILPYL